LLKFSSFLILFQNNKAQDIFSERVISFSFLIADGIEERNDEPHRADK
jgi:hypothetical protein